MYQAIYEMILYTFLDYQPTSPLYLYYEPLAIVISTVLMIMLAFLLLKISLWLVSIPFRWLS